MPRKKTPTNTNAATAAVNLDDDEQLVEEITTTKKIGRQRRTPASKETITVDIEDDDDDLEAPVFAEGSLAAVLLGESNENYETQYCTVQIRRNPDSMNDQFLTPCGAVSNLPPLRNVELAAEKMEIEERVRSEYGGGHYFFQIYYEGSYRHSWKATLADDPAAVARAKAEKQTPAASVQTPIAAPADPLDSMISSITKMKALKDALFGDEEARLKEQIADLKAEVANKPEPSSEPQNERLAILEKALGVANPTLQDKMLDYVFPDDGGEHWLPATLKTVFEHKDEIGGIVGSLLGGFLPQPKPQGIEQLLRQQPPAGALPAPTETPQPTFRRRTAPVEIPETDTGKNADEIATAETPSKVEAAEPPSELLQAFTLTAEDVIDPFAEPPANDGDDADTRSEGNDDER